MNIALLHIPKTAGCAICEALGQSPPGHHQVQSKEFQQYVKREGTPYVITVVRDPLDRAVSMFRFLQGLRALKPSRLNLRWLDGVQGAVSELCRHFSLNEFWECVDVEFIWERYSFLRPQTWYFEPNEVDRILRFETLENDWATLREDLLVDLPDLSKVNVSHAAMSQLSLVATKRIKKLYHDDFQRFYPNL